MTPIKVLLAASIVTGAGMGAFALASAATDDSSAQTSRGPELQEALEVEIPEPLVVAATSGSEQSVFKYEISDTVGNDLVHSLISDIEGVCAVFELKDGSIAEPCFDAQTVATGLAYGLFGEEDGSFTMIGIVPDTVDTVELGGNAIEISGNVWSTNLKAASPAELRVGDSATNRWVTLGRAGS